MEPVKTRQEGCFTNRTGTSGAPGTSSITAGALFVQLSLFLHRHRIVSGCQSGKYRGCLEVGSVYAVSVASAQRLDYREGTGG
jgi:hypothetical protein